jgi:hypothetical protein
MTLTLAGYRFGESNHAVYLLAAIRENNPALLANDWWTRSTLQYHFVFNHLSAWLMRVGWIEQVFLGAYVALAVLLHVGWRSLTFALGGTDRVYLVAVILYHLMAAGTGLGMYQFLQDSSFLPSNVANVAMLWGVYFWIRRRPVWSGLWLGVAGLFHLNHALAGIGLWIGLAVLARLHRRAEPHSPSPGTPREGGGEGSSEGETRTSRATNPHPNPLPEYRERGPEGAAAWFIGTALLLALSAPAIVPAVQSVLAKTASLPLREFVDLYVRLRHPHHYDPSSWPAALWISFLLPIALAIPAYRAAERENPNDALARARHAFVLFCGMLIVGLLGAGLFYVSEPLVQMSLYRFSIFPKLLSCVAAAWLIVRSGWGVVVVRTLVMTMFLGVTAVILSRAAMPPFVRANLFPMWLFALFASVALLRPRVLGWGRELFGTLTATCVVVSLVLSWHKLGITHEGLRGDDTGYLELCDWASKHIPTDAVLLVPPDEQSMRLHGRRAIVVNFKNVPQLSGELGEWRDRLQNVLEIDDLRRLPRPFHKTLDAIRARYAELPAEHLVQAARRYGARYVLSVHRFDTNELGAPVFSDSGGRYFLYDLHEPLIPGTTR